MKYQQQSVQTKVFDSLSILIIAIVMFIGSAGASEQHAQTEYRIGFHFWKSGKIYDDAMLGIKDGLELNDIRYSSVILHANKNKNQARENFKKLDSMGLGVIYSLSSAGTKIAKELKLKTPVVATVINHPASLGVTSDGSRDEVNLTGTSYYVDAVKQLNFYLSLFPKINTIGMIYDKNNPAGYLAEQPFLKAACEQIGKKFYSYSVDDKQQLANVTKKLMDKRVDLVVIPTNRLVYKNLSQVLVITNKYKIPVVSMNKQGVENGALAGLYADTYNLGRFTAPMVKQILIEKISPKQIDFGYISQPDIIVNLDAAKTLQYKFPAQVLGEAAIVLQ